MLLSLITNQPSMKGRRENYKPSIMPLLATCFFPLISIQRGKPGQFQVIIYDLLLHSFQLMNRREGGIQFISMPFSISSPSTHKSLIWVFFFFIGFVPATMGDPRITQAGIHCGTTRVSTNQIIPDFVKEMEGMAASVDKQGWGTHSYGSNNLTIYSLAQCMDDLSHTDCLLCFTESRTKLPRCLPSISARMYLDGCFLRWDNYSFYAQSVDPLLDQSVCNSTLAFSVTTTTTTTTKDEENSNKLEFTQKVNQVIKNVTESALVSNHGFAVAEVKGEGEVASSVYALAQCWKTINKTGCRLCLEKAGREASRCSPGQEGRGLNAGCYLRYSTHKFYDDGGEDSHNGGFSRVGLIVATTIASLAFVMLSLLGAFVGYKRLTKIRQERENLGRLTSNVSKSNLNFKYETLEKATKFFDLSRKLGQGGAGSVYKGTLPDGRNVAVKRLFFNTRHWVDEFFNEVNLISGIKHKNLVQLLGCSIEGPESLLVYEYVVNRSLDQVLFEMSTEQYLNWRQRFHIIVGIAEGLAYLHGGSPTRIIHRDIKSSNILLDESLTAKIADFGLARCFAPDKSHLSTGIAGTLGYMAPEYLVRGQLTEKADVYSFGVLVLEIVCGRKNTVFMQESTSSVLQTVWKNYKSNILPQSVDSSLRKDYLEEEASNVLQIGLLCTQASVSMRPSMSQVVQMLTDRDYPIPLPMQPPFLNASLMDPCASTMSSSMPTTSYRPTDTSNKFCTSMSSSTSGTTTVEVSLPR